MILDLHKNALYRYNSSMQSAKQEIQELKSLLKDPTDLKYYKGLQIVLFRLMGKSYQEMIELLDCNQTGD